MTVDEVLAVLDGVTGSGPWKARCPVHDDQHASLSINVKHGHVLWHCHAGCDQPSVTAAIQALLGASTNGASGNGGTKRKLVASYAYTNASGAPVFYRDRYEWYQNGARTKAVYPRQLDGTKSGNAPVPYNLHRVVRAMASGEQIIFVEGEKPAEALIAAGFCATTTGGATSWRSVLAEHFRNARVALWPDADEPGERHMAAVAAALAPIVADLRVLRFADKSNGWDAADFFCEGGTEAQLDQLLSDAPAFAAAQMRAEAANGARSRTRSPKVPRVLPDPFPEETPWPQAVSGAELLDDLVLLLQHFLVLPTGAAPAMALWIVHTYVIDAADFTPYLLITSPVRECGKSTTLELLSNLACRAQLTGGITAAALYRRIDRWHPTMLIDELDSRLRTDGGEQLRSVLNTGFSRSGRMTVCAGDEHEDRDYATFCPKVLAAIDRVWDTVASRSIPIRLRRATSDERTHLERIRGDRIREQCRPYRQRAVRWQQALRETLRSDSCSDPVVPDELGARQADVWRPLLAIADAAGGHWPTTARDSARTLHGVAEEEGDLGLLLLGDLRDIVQRTADGRATTSYIAEELAKLDDRPWPEYRNGRPITQNGIARLMKRFEVKSKNIRGADGVLKGYELDQLKPLFALYLPPSGVAATPATLPENADVAVVAPFRSGIGQQDDRGVIRSDLAPLGVEDLDIVVE